MALSQTKARPMLRSSTVPVTGPSPQQDGPSDGDHATRPIGECKVPAELVSTRRGLALLPASAGGRCLKMQAAAQSADAVRILVMLAAIAIVAFWRSLLKLVIVLVAAATIAGIGYGAIAVWQSVQHVAR
jgi:hypothetical protein